MAKKPFKETWLGRLVRGFVRDLPLIGGIKDHLDSTDPADGGEKGKLDKVTLTGQIMAILLPALALAEYLGYLPPWIHDLIVKVIENIQF